MVSIGWPNVRGWLRSGGDDGEPDEPKSPDDDESGDDGGWSTLEYYGLIGACLFFVGTFSYLLFTAGLLFWAIKASVGMAIVIGGWFMVPMALGKILPDAIHRLNFKLGLNALTNPYFEGTGDSEYDVYEDLMKDVGPEGRRERCLGTRLGFVWDPHKSPHVDTYDGPKDSPYEGVEMADGGEEDVPDEIQTSPATVGFSDTIRGAFPYTKDNELLVLKESLRKFAGKGAYEMVEQARRKTMANETGGMSSETYFKVLAFSGLISLLLGAISFFILPEAVKILA